MNEGMSPASISIPNYTSHWVNSIYRIIQHRARGVSQVLYFISALQAKATYTDTEQATIECSDDPTEPPRQPHHQSGRVSASLKRLEVLEIEL